MKAQGLSIGLIAVNLALLALLLGREIRARDPAQSSSSSAQEAAPILRGRALVLVDERGQVRSRLDVYPDGEVVFRLLDRNGTIRVKLGASEDGSGLLLLDGATEPGVHVIARRTGTSTKPATTSLTLQGPGGQRRVIAP